ncbi:MAG TPA: hypothetical protein VN113_05915 [Caulobacter sp.]|nr:hypothetical protein [Caulobacter sp.]
MDVGVTGHAKTRRRFIWIATGVELGLLFGAATFVRLQHIHVPNPVVALSATAVLSAHLLLWWIYWRTLDEAFMEANKSAWLWGSVVGAAALVPLMAFLPSERLEGLLGPLPVGKWMALGVVAVLFAQVTGFFVAYGAWWLRRR